jgi:hypothetical protein
MTDPEAQQMMLSLLTSIDGSLKKLVAVAEKRKAAAEPPVADDRDLDGPHGDEMVKFSPRNWDERDGLYKGSPMSHCPPAFLDLLAEAFESFAKKNSDKGDDKKAGYDKRSAARARGWAKRLRSGWKPAASSSRDDSDFGREEDFGGL